MASLYSIEHTGPESIVLNQQVVTPQKVHSPVPTVACSAFGCGRCKDRRGGYQFRWYSQYWHTGYLAARRPGSWVPGEPERAQ